MIGFSRDGESVVGVLEQAEAQVFGLVVAQVAGLVEYHRRATGSQSVESELFGGPPVIELEEIPSGDELGLGLGPQAVEDDPVLARLFPDAYRDDPDASAELRGLMLGDLHAQKLEHATTLLATLPLGGGEIRLGPTEAESWLLALNDARLALGTRLGVSDKMDLVEELEAADKADPGGPRVLALSVYHLLGFAQESLVDALTA